MIDTRNHSINTLEVDMPVKKTKKQLKRENKKAAEQTQAEKSADPKASTVGSSSKKNATKDLKGQSS